MKKQMHTSGRLLFLPEGDKKHAAVMHRTYDVRTVCRRDGDDTDTQPAEFHISGEISYSAWSVFLAAGAAAAVCGLLSAASRLKTAAKYRRLYQRRYADRLRREKERLLVRYEKRMHAGQLKSAVPAAFSTSRG